MLTVAQDNPIAIVIAVLIGIAVGWWIFRAVRSDRRVSGADAPDSIDQPKQRLIRDGVDTIEGRGLADEVGAAARDVAGEILGVDAHITRFDQLAALSANEVEILDSRMGAFRGRVARDRLVEQACYLARGDTDGFEANFGKLGNA
ncbi:MAG: hypothetical protein E6G94_04440 [Alphaproteobacteria bacterium]|nr:MAG: hypothetical protein E6G94_04440 [Alphaproteobacteria bacterium]